MPLTHVVTTVKPLLLAHNHRVLWSYQFQKQYPKLILYHLCTSIYQWNGFCYFSAPQEEEETESDEGKYIEPKRLLHWLTCNCQPSKSLSMTLFHFYTYNMPRKYLQHYLSFMRGIKMSPVDAPHKCWVMRVSMFSWILPHRNGWTNFRFCGDLRRHGSEVTSVLCLIFPSFSPLNKRLVTDIYEHGFVTVMCDDYAYFPDESIETTTPGQMRE